jgi:hypothetical protein
MIIWVNCSRGVSSIYLYKHDPLRVIETYSLHMQSVHVGIYNSSYSFFLPELCSAQHCHFILSAPRGLLASSWSNSRPPHLKLIEFSIAPTSNDVGVTIGALHTVGVNSWNFNHRKTPPLSTCGSQHPRHQPVRLTEGRTEAGFTTRPFLPPPPLIIPVSSSQPRPLPIGCHHWCMYYSIRAHPLKLAAG